MGLAPSRVRIRPYTIQGCRPSSAVIHPAVFAMYGKGNASIRIHSMRPAPEQRAAPQEKRRGGHHDDEQRTQPCHHVEGVVKQLDVVRPGVLGKLVQSGDIGVERAVRKKAEDAWYDDRIVQPLFSDVRLTDQDDAGHGPALEASFHGRQARRLVLRDELGLSIAGRKRYQHTRDDSGDDTHAKEATGLIVMTRLQRVVRAHGSHHERRRHDRRDHGVGVLHEAQGLNRKDQKSAR